MASNSGPAAINIIHDPSSIPETPIASKDELGEIIQSPHGVKSEDNESQDSFPTDEELHSLRRVSDKISWKVYTLAVVELCERFSYYGTTVVFTNFIQQSLPVNSKTGAGFDGQSGALGMGQQASTGIGTFNQVWVYLVPLFGVYVADKYLGRYKTISISLAIAIVGHIILIIAAIPPVIVHSQSSLACFLIGLIIMGLGTGSFKPNISPMIAEQLHIKKMTVKTLPSGKNVIVDPTVTQSRVYHYFYMFINIGALTGQIGMGYCEKYVGFWLSFLLPTILLSMCPLVLWYARNKYVRTPPEGSVLGKSLGLFILANKGRWSLNPLAKYRRLNDGTFWTSVKPSAIPRSQYPSWMTFDDKWVDEVGRGFNACAVFCWVPLYWQPCSNSTASQTICDIFIYPLLRRAKINFSPIKKITAGFFTGSAAMIWAAVLQFYIYKKSICGHNATGLITASLGGNGKTRCPPVPIDVWAQAGAYILIAISEILASISTLEYAFSNAPTNMRSLVTAFGLFMTAIAAALGEAFVGISSDPHLVCNYSTMALLSAIEGICFWLQFRGLDHDEDQLNALPAGHISGREGEIEGISMRIPGEGFAEKP